MTTQLTTADLITAVKAHAVEHYNDGGWDVIVETYTDADIAEHIGRARTIKGALAKFADVVGVWADRQADAASYEEPYEPEPEPWRACCSRMNIDCCGHDDPEEYDPVTPDQALAWTLMWPTLNNHSIFARGLEIISVNYCEGPVPF